MQRRKVLDEWKWQRDSGVNFLKFLNFRSQIKTQMKRKAFEDAGLPQPTEPSPKKQAVRAEKTPQVVTVTTATVSASVESQPKKQPQNGTWFNIQIRYM